MYSAAEKESKFLLSFFSILAPNLSPLASTWVEIDRTDVKSKHLWRCGQWVDQPHPFN